MINVGERIKKLRKSKGFTSGSLAEQLELSQSFVSGIENGSKKCSLETLDSICTILNITLAEFFQEDESNISPDVKRLLEASKHLTAEQKELITKFLETLK